MGREASTLPALTASHTTAATPSLLQSWVSRRSWPTKRNCAEELWSFDSAGSEFSTYGTRAMLQNNRKHNAQPFLTGRQAHARCVTSCVDLQETLRLLPSPGVHMHCSKNKNKKIKGTPAQKIKGTPKQHNVTPSQSHFCETNCPLRDQY